MLCVSIQHLFMFLLVPFVFFANTFADLDCHRHHTLCDVSRIAQAILLFLMYDASFLMPWAHLQAGIVAPVFTIVGLLVLLAGSPSLFTVIAVLGGTTRLSV